MWDGILAALIAIVSGLVGFAGSYLVTKSQNDARLDELRLRLDRESEEAKRNRVIEARKSYLVPLREVLSKWLRASNDNYSAAVRFQAAQEKGDEARLRETFIELLKQMEESRGLSIQLDIHRGQISDAKLDQLIERATKADSNTAVERMRLVDWLNKNAALDAATIRAEWSRYEAILSQLRAELVPINKRIEELLSGEPYE